MQASERDIDEVSRRLIQDARRTLSHGYEERIREIAKDAARWTPLEHYTERVVQEFQQYIHDCFIHTSWPPCPRHSHHPIWFSDGCWRADGEPLAKLGELFASESEEG
jgi:hypothetical protein